MSSLRIYPAATRRSRHLRDALNQSRRNSRRVCTRQITRVRVMAIIVPPTTPSAASPEDSLAKLVGQFGKWQLIIFASVILVKFPSGWVQMAIVFLTPTTAFRCVKFASNRTLAENSTCYRDCVKYEYDTSPMVDTIVSRWDLICDRAWLASFNQTMLQLGILCGSVIFGFLSDRYGRKITFLIAVTAMTVLGVGVPFSPNYLVFTSLRFLLGFATSGTMVVSFVIVMEVVGPRYREILGSVYQIPFIMGHLTVPLIAYLYRSWDTYLLVLGCTNIIFLMYFFLLSESPRWLLSVGDVDKATRIVTKAAKMNKLSTKNIQEDLKKLSAEVRAKVDQPKPNYTALLRVELRVRTACAIVVWLFIGHTFYGFNQYIGQTSPNPFLSVAVSALVQFPAILISIWMMKIVGRKISCIVSLVGGGACIIALGLVPQTFGLTLTLGAIGVSFSSISAICIYIYTSELFPTVVRNMGFGVCSMAMRIGSMIAPFTAGLSTTAVWAPTAIFGVTPLVAGLTVVFLPETKDLKLPDTIEDIKADK